MKNLLTIPITILICIVFILSDALDTKAQQNTNDEFQTLVELYNEFREYRLPEVTNGVPDYTADAMAAKHDGLKEMQQQLADIDTAGWPIPRQVDYHIVKSEMNAMDFTHRVMRPWSRDPAFYAVILFQFGTKMHPSVNIPNMPMSAERAEQFRTEMQAIPKILDQARNNLTEPKGDLAYIGIHTKDMEEEELLEAMPGIREHHPDLVSSAEEALQSLRDFRSWLREIRPTLEPQAGIGIDNYNWYMENVLLSPYDWQELMTLCKREYEESMAMLELKEYGNRHTPILEPVDNKEDYVHRYNSALHHLHEYLHKEELFTVPEYFGPPDSADSYNRGEKRDYFANVLDRYPLPLSAHGYAGHDLDTQRYSRDDRPIRGQSRLYFVEGIRAEGIATGIEKWLSYTGLIDDVPRAEELLYNLKAFRAIRSVTDLRMQANELSFEEAFKYNTDYTPYEWTPADSPTLWHDLELYLRTPGYGLGYVIGPILIEKMMTERIHQVGEENFDMRAFMDEFLETGFMQIPLIRWEMTGRSLSEQEPYWE